MESITQQIYDLKNQLAQLEQLRIKEQQNSIKKALYHNTPIDNNFNNIRVELFKRKFGFWKKVQDDHYNIERETWKRLRATYNGFDEQYITDFPDEIISKENQPPDFQFAISQGFSANNAVNRRHARHYKDNRNGNNVTYHFITTDPDKSPVSHHTLASILYLLENITNRVNKLENS